MNEFGFVLICLSAALSTLCIFIGVEHFAGIPMADSFLVDWAVLIWLSLCLFNYHFLFSWGDEGQQEVKRTSKLSVDKIKIIRNLSGCQKCGAGLVSVNGCCSYCGSDLQK
jgi:ribosomal protein L32